MNTQHRRSRVITAATRIGEVPRARRRIVNTLHDWGISEDDDAVHAVRLIASELLANVVHHAAAATAEMSVVVELVDGVRIRMGVHDGHPDCPGPVESDAEAVSGRGLKIVHDLVEEFEGAVFIERTDDGGKTIWVELARAGDRHATDPYVADPYVADRHAVDRHVTGRHATEVLPRICRAAFGAGPGLAV